MLLSWWWRPPSGDWQHCIIKHSAAVSGSVRLICYNSAMHGRLHTTQLLMVVLAVLVGLTGCATGSAGTPIRTAQPAATAAPQPAATIVPAPDLLASGLRHRLV